MRTASKDAYKDLKKSGKQQSQADYIYCILEYADSTGFTLQEIKLKSSLEINAVSGRVNDLKKVGRVVELPKRKCTVTGRLVTPVGVSQGQGDLF